MKGLLIIVEKGANPDKPYVGHACCEAGIRPGLYYCAHEREYAELELSKLNKIYPRRFELKAILRELALWT